MTDFKKFNLPNSLMQSLERMQIVAPTPVQTLAIPLALAGRDILATAQTGTGKTLAYALPLAAKLLAEPHSAALILAPTRELAAQVQTSLRQLLGHTIPMALLIGGESMQKQFFQLRARPRLVIGTPGRINDHLSRRNLHLKDTNFLVIDEADRMLDMGFSVQLEKIAQYLPQVKQTMMFSATLPSNIVRLSESYMHKPERICVDSVSKPATNIKQEIIHTSSSDKFPQLMKELESREGSIIVFVKTRRNAEHLAIKLQRENHSAEAIHGDLNQRQRDRVIQSFRDHRNRIMVATDIAARGLDIPHIRHVINYDLPQCPEDYIHRIGRTARAGAEGNALCIISPEDNHKWKLIHRLIHPDQSANNGPKFGARRPSSSYDGQRKRPARRKFPQERKASYHS